MGAPWEKKPQSGIVVPGGTKTTVVLDVPSRSNIHKFVVIQYEGNEDPFSATLYNHKDALEGTEQSESSSYSDSDVQARIPLGCYLIGLPLVSSGGAIKYFSDDANGGSGMPFVSQDPPRQDRQGQKGTKLYIVLDVTGTGEKKFAISVGGEAIIGD